LEQKDSISEELIARFLRNEVNEQERTAVLAYLQSSAPDDVVAQTIFEKSWEREEDAAENLSPLLYERLQSRLDIPTQKTYISRPVVYRMAASFLLLAACIYGVTTYWQHVLNIIDPVHYVTRETYSGQRMEFKLPDGSHIVLNAGSKLTYPDKFRNGKRDISLEGEAFFEVVRDEQKPFIVRTGHMRTQVLGTSFNIQAYPNEHTMRVSVLTGKVAVSLYKDSVDATPEQQQLLTVNEQVYFDRVTGAFEKQYVSAVPFVAWTEGKLILRNASFREIAHTLERWYNVKIELHPAAGEGCRFTANFGENTALRDVLEMLHITNHIQYSIEANSVKLYEGKCNP
jgi:transmembrane sensor